MHSTIELDLAQQRSLLGRIVHDEDVATAQPMRAMRAVFSRDEAAAAHGEEIPPGWHNAYFAPNTPRTGIGHDGMPMDNGVLPEMPLPRRMHAGCRLIFHAPIRVGDALRRESEFTSLQLKAGKNGPLIFAVQTRRIYTRDGLALTEENTSVFRDHDVSTANARAPGPASVPAEAPTWRKTVVPDAVSLFRYSAATHNAHRIHYDRAYAGEEGYPGLVVHGMFIGQCLIDLARDHMPGARLRHFSFKAIAPLFDTEPFHLHAEPLSPQALKLVASSAQGTVAMVADIGYSTP